MKFFEWFDSEKKLRLKLENTRYDRDFWRKQAICCEEHREFWRKTSDYYRDKWHEALECIPEKRKRLELLGESKDFIDYECQDEPEKVEEKKTC